MYNKLLAIVRGSPETFGFLIALSLYNKEKWANRLALRRIISALLGRKLHLTELDEITENCETFLDVSFVSRCQLSLPRKSLCKIIRIKPQYHALFKEKLGYVLRIMGIKTDALLSIYEELCPLFEYENRNVCPQVTLYCFRSKATPSIIIGEPSRRYSTPQIREMIRQKKITPEDAFLYIPVDSQIIAIVLSNLRKKGYVLVSKKFLSGFPDRVTGDEWTEERIENSIHPLENLNLVVRSISKGASAFRLLFHPPHQLFHIRESLEIEKRSGTILKRIKNTAASTGLHKCMQDLKDIIKKFTPPK